MKYYVRTYKTPDIHTGYGSYMVIEGDTMEQAVNSNIKRIVKSLCGKDYEIIMEYPEKAEIKERVDKFIDFEGREKEERKYTVSITCKVRSSYTKDHPLYEEYTKTYEAPIYDYIH